MQEYQLKKVLPRSVPNVTAETIENLIESMDKRGIWIEELAIPDYKDVVNNPRRKLQGISTGTFLRNMRTFINYLENNNN